MTRPALLDIPLVRIDGAPAALADYAGKVLLVVNVASRCGFTPQYAGLEALYRTRRDRGLAVLGFPSNDFKGQEPGSDAEIAAFCETTYGVDFPMFAKIRVIGPGRHPLYDALAEAHPETSFPAGSTLRQHLPERAPGEVHWNFEKFLVGRDGSVIGRFAPDTDPQDPALVAAIEAALAAPAEVGA
jgi:glutathione peroxidase